tara:strand:- start:761 stop:1231 length:471 start_codon:yes stop_codon:yes gene_type:complete
MKKTPMRLKDREILVSKIVKGVEANNLKVVTKAIRSTKEYKTARTYVSDIETLREQRDALIEKINAKTKKVNDLVEKVNHKLPIKNDENNYGFEVGLKFGTNTYDKYQGLAIVSELGWTVRENIAEEVTLATMLNYCQEDIMTIIEQLTETFSGGK